MWNNVMFYVCLGMGYVQYALPPFYAKKENADNFWGTRCSDLVGVQSQIRWFWCFSWHRRGIAQINRSKKPMKPEQKTNEKGEVIFQKRGRCRQHEEPTNGDKTCQSWSTRARTTSLVTKNGTTNAFDLPMMGMVRCRKRMNKIWLCIVTLGYLLWWALSPDFS